MLDVNNYINIGVSCVAVAQQMNSIPHGDRTGKCEMMGPASLLPTMNFFSIFDGQTLDICRTFSFCAEDCLCET